MDDEAVRTDLHILVTQRLGVEDQLDHRPLLDVRHGVDCLKSLLYEVKTILEFQIFLPVKYFHWSSHV